jgi:DNA-directed RNA polymerase specialized sigma24 family protein
MSTLREIRAALVRLSRRHARVEHEVEDLAHDIIVSALRRGLSLDGDVFPRCAHAAARRHAAFVARTAARRRAREASIAGPLATDADLDLRDDADDLAALSPSLRTTLLLLLSGLEKAELRVALGVNDAALRKRFQVLRDHGLDTRPDLPVTTRTPALLELRRSQVELLPRLPNTNGRVLAAADPDGHGLIFAQALTSDGGTATSHGGPPCSTRRSRTSPSSSS